MTHDYNELLQLLSGRPHTVSFAGHTHTTEHHYLGADQGFGGPGKHHHHVLTAASGSWWSGPADTFGMPLAASRDGTPKGFHILSIYGNRYSTRFVPVNHSGNYQMRISVMDSAAGPADTHQTQPNAMTGLSLSLDQLDTAMLAVNVFDGGPRTEVTYVVQTGAAPPTELSSKSAFAMQRVAMTDPFTVGLYARHRRDLKPWVEAAASSHIWQAPLPENLTPGVHRVIVSVRDEYARRHTSAAIIEVTARLRP